MIPHLVIESSPAKFHAYVLVDGVLPLNLFTPLQHQLADQYGGDHSVCDRSRVMRVPGFIHQKGKPFRTRIIEENLDAPFLSAKSLIDKIAVQVDTPLRKQTPLNKSLQRPDHQRPLPEWLPEALDHIDPEPYNPWLHVGMALHHATGGNDNGLQIWIEWSSTASNFDEQACYNKWGTFGGSDD